MDAKTFFKSHRADVRAVCDAAGTSVNYFQQIACGHRRPSVGLAKRLAVASGGRMTPGALLGIDVTPLAA